MNSPQFGRSVILGELPSDGDRHALTPCASNEVGPPLKVPAA
jgi:hypothetical protein